MRCAFEKLGRWLGADHCMSHGCDIIISAKRSQLFFEPGPVFSDLGRQYYEPVDCSSRARPAFPHLALDRRKRRPSAHAGYDSQPSLRSSCPVARMSEAICGVMGCRARARIYFAHPGRANLYRIHRAISVCFTRRQITWRRAESPPSNRGPPTAIGG
jgi:hypothetical protein